MRKPLGVAVVGVGAEQWSGIAHLPAIAATPGVDLVRLVTSNPESARVAGRRWRVPSSDDMADALVDPSVDVVTVTVRVARHREIVEKAIAAGKHVYCEWPLTVSTEEARALARLSAAHPAQVHMVGLQGRFSPDLRASACAVRAGEIGKPLAASAQVLINQGLLARPQHRAHLRERSSAANVLTIQTGHTLDMLAAVLGQKGSVDSARIWTAVAEFTVAETGQRLSRDAPDNVSTLLRLGGVPVTAQFSQTSAREIAILEVLGDAGSIRIVATGQPQMSELSVTLTELSGLSRAVVGAVSEDVAIDRSHPGFNVALAYGQVVESVASGDSSVDLPNFEHAVGLYELLDDLDQKALS